MAWRQEHPLRQQAQHQLHQHEHAISCQAVDQSILTERSSVHSVQTLSRSPHKKRMSVSSFITMCLPTTKQQAPPKVLSGRTMTKSRWLYPKSWMSGSSNVPHPDKGSPAKSKNTLLPNGERERTKSQIFAPALLLAPPLSKDVEKTTTHCGVWTYTNQPPCKASPSCFYQACVSRIDTDTTSAHQACPTTSLPPYFILPVTREGPASNHLPNAKRMKHVTRRTHIDSSPCPPGSAEQS